MLQRKHLDPDEPAFEICVDYAGSLGASRTLADRPGANLFIPSGEVAFETERAIGLSRDMVESRFFQSHRLKHLGAFAWDQLRDLGFDLRADHDDAGTHFSGVLPYTANQPGTRKTLPSVRN